MLPIESFAARFAHPAKTTVVTIFNEATYIVNKRGDVTQWTGMVPMRVEKDAETRVLEGIALDTINHFYRQEFGALPDCFVIVHKVDNTYMEKRFRVGKKKMQPES